MILVAFGVVVSAVIGLKLPPKPSQVVAQDQSVCGGSCTTDSNCGSNNFCHATINWENWEEQTSVLNAVGSGQITGWNTHFKPDDDPVYHLVRGGKVYTQNQGGWDGGNDFSGCFGNNPGQCGTLTADKGDTDNLKNLTNPVVGYNTIVRTENGVQVLITQLVRYREIYEQKTNYLTGVTISPWTKITVLDNLLTNHGGSWDQWAFLSFDSAYAYEDGRQQQRLIIGRVDDRGTATVNDDRIYDTKMITRLNVRNAEGNFTWSPWTLAAHTTNNTTTQGLGGTGAQGSLVSYDSSYNLDAVRYKEAIVRWYWNGSAYVAQVWHREALKRTTPQLQCRPLVYPQSCAMPAYVPPIPTNTSYVPPSPTQSASDIPVPQNFSKQVACSQGKVTFSWTMPTSQASYEIGHAVFEYCRKTSGSQTTCTNPQRYEVPDLALDLDQATKYARDNAFSSFGLTNGQEALVRLRLSPQAVPEIDIVGEPTAYISVKYTGPEGDYNNNCTVNITDYADVVGQLFEEELDHVLTDNWALFFLNKLIRNFGTSN